MPLGRLFRLASCLLLLIVPTAPPARALDVIIADDAFAMSNWTTIWGASGGATPSESQSAGGNPGPYRFMVHNLPSPSSITLMPRAMSSRSDCLSFSPWSASTSASPSVTNTI